MFKKGDNFDWAYVAYDGVCTFAKGHTINGWAGERSNACKKTFEARYGVCRSSDKVGYETVDS